MRLVEVLPRVNARFGTMVDTQDVDGAIGVLRNTVMKIGVGGQGNESMFSHFVIEKEFEFVFYASIALEVDKSSQ